MTAITQGLASCYLATTKENFAAFLCRVFQRRKISLLMRTVTKGLFLAKSAGTPEIILPGFHFNSDWFIASSDCFTHLTLPKY